MHNITKIASKMLMVLACAIILMHAMVPHHHHDSCGIVGIVFEDEVTCHCDEEAVPCQQCAEHHSMSHSHDHSHHPFDLCRLQDLLSKLVISSKEDETYLALASIAEHDTFLTVIPTLFGEESLASFNIQSFHPIVDEALPLDVITQGTPLRAPPRV